MRVKLKTLGSLLHRARQYMNPGRFVKVGAFSEADLAEMNAKLTGNGRCKCGLLADASGTCGDCVKGATGYLGRRGEQDCTTGAR